MKNFTKSFFNFPNSGSNLVKIFIIAAVLIGYYLVLRGYIKLPSVISLGPVNIHFYGLAILGGIATTSYFVNKEIKKFSWSKNLVFEDALFFVLIPGVIGARLWHVITDWYLYQNDPVAALYIWNGGLGIYGGIIGGLLGAYIYCRKQKLPFLQILDLLVVFIPLAQIIGRLGNLVNQEIFGPKTSLPWGFYVERLGNYFHPAFLYEQLGNLILFIILYNTYKYLRSKSYPQDQLNHKLIQHKLTRLFVGKSGSLFILYLLGYAFIRFIVDFFRLEPAFYLGLTFAQFFSLLVMSGCLFPLILKEQKYRQS